MRHGLLAQCVVLPEESAESFEAMLCQHLDRFHPADGVEFAMVEDLAAAYWRMRRAWAVETAMLEGALHNQPPEGAGANPSGEAASVARLAAAFRSLASEPGLPLLHRYEARLHRMYQRALHNLSILQNVVPNQNLPNEPSPISGHNSPGLQVVSPAAVEPADPG
jgi:hypothetical protein